MAKVFATTVEQRITEVASRWAGRAARLAPQRADAAFGGHLSAAWLIAPSFSIRAANP